MNPNKWVFYVSVVLDAADREGERRSNEVVEARKKKMDCRGRWLDMVLRVHDKLLNLMVRFNFTMMENSYPFPC